MSEPKQYLLESARFTSMTAYLLEIDALLQAGERLELIIPKEKREQFEHETENWKAMGRVKVRFV